MKVANDSNLISVIVPVYNAEKYLARCIDSIRNQIYQNIEIILVDDGSTDICSRMIDEYASKDHRVIPIHKENAGVSAARNKGIEKACGEYLMFVDADDWIDAEMVQELYDALKSKTADIVCSYFYINYEKPKEINQTEKIVEVDIEQALMRCLKPQPPTYAVTLWGKMFRTAACKQYLYNVEDIFVGEDMVALSNAIVNAGKVLCSNKAYYHYFLNPSGAMKTINDKCLSDIRAHEIAIDIVGGKYSKIAKYLSLRSSISSYAMLKIAFKSGNRNYNLIDKLQENVMVNYESVPRELVLTRKGRLLFRLLTKNKLLFSLSVIYIKTKSDFKS